MILADLLSSTRWKKYLLKRSAALEGADKYLTESSSGDLDKSCWKRESERERVILMPRRSKERFETTKKSATQEYYDFRTRVLIFHPSEIISREILSDIFLSNSKLLISRQASCKISRETCRSTFPPSRSLSPMLRCSSPRKIYSVACIYNS